MGDLDGEYCPIPSSPEFGSVDYTGIRPNNDVTYSCEPGYTEQGRSTFKCLVSGQWENPPTICRSITCPDPGPIRNGYVTGADFRFNKRIRFSCNRGYELDGARSLLCDEFGYWDDDKPSCVAVQCQLPKLSLHTIPSTKDKRVPPGTTLTFSCTVGYKLQTDHNSVRCQIDGSFNRSVPTCDPEKCLKPPDVLNADVVNPKAEYGVGEIVKYTCQYGYDFDPYARKPIDSVNCLPSGDWEADLPFCNEIICPDPPIVRKGVSIGDGRNVGSEVTYRCEPGYRGMGRNLVKCRNFGDWSRLSFRCRPVNCKAPSRVLFGTAVGTDFTFNSVVTYQCDQGYQSDGPAQRRCQENGTWSERDPDCLPIDCGKPPEISRGRVTSKDSTYSSIASYSCNRGYVMKGDETLTCEANSQWSPDPPKCEPRPCAAPDYVPQATYTSPPQLVFNTSIKYTCNTGYKMEGERERVCTEDGSWYPEPPVCEIIRCHDLYPPTHGSMKVDNYTYLSVAVYSCDTNYALTGVDARTCQADGTWSDSVPHCKATKCERPGPIDYAIIDFKDLSVGSIVRYSCETGYLLDGSSIRRCEDDFHLTGEDPVCRPVKCPKLDNLKNGQIYASDILNEFGTTASFACDEGYILDGIEEIKCIFNGTWSGGLPTCRPVECPKAGKVISNGRMSGSSFTYESVISYQCDKGYRLVGAENRTCLSDGIWDNPVPTCQHVECPRPRLVYGSVSTFKRTFGTIVEYSCRGNYRLEGPAERTCMADGQWSGSEPKCLEIKCDAPAQVDHADSTVINETTVRYQCHRGYDLEGPQFRVCGNDRVWRPDSPRCVSSYCEDLSDDEFANGTITFTSAKVGVYVEYECDTGFKLRGQARRRCLPSRIWDGDEPRCQVISCGHPGILPDGRIIGDDYTYNATVTFECNPGFQLGDVKSIRCLETGLWENKYPFCKEAKCPQLEPVIDDGYVSVTSYRPGGEANYDCIEGFRMEGESSRVCERNGQWSGEEPLCVVVECQQPEAVEHGIMYGWKETYGYGDEIIFECEPGYYIEGDNARYCTETGQWTQRIPLCLSIYCPELPYLENGHIEGDSASYKARLTYTCDPGYELIGEENSECLSDATWSGDERACVRISCEEPLTIDNAGIVQDDGRFFQDAIIYACDVGYTPYGNNKIVCQENKTWSNTDFRCTIVSCPTISDDDVPRATFTQGPFSYGSIITFSCEIGYVLSGSSALQCTPIGRWNDTYPQCDIVICNNLPSLTFGSVSVDSNHYGSMANFTCDVGHSLIGASNVTCLASGLWDDVMPICRIISCPQVSESDFPFGIFQASSFTYGDSVTFTCNKGYIIQGSQTLNCTSQGLWDASYPTCQIVTCPELAELEFGTVISPSREYGTFSNFICNVGYSLIGSDSILCLASGLWSGNIPVCEIISCPDIFKSDIPNGSFFSTSFTFGSVVNFICEKGHRMHGSSSIACLADKTWNASYPVCNIITCPKLGSLAHGRISSESLEYGATAHFWCENGYNLHGSVNMTCLDSGSWSDSMPVCQIKSCPKILASDFANGVFTFDSFTYGSKVRFLCNEGYLLTGPTLIECLAEGNWSSNYPVCDIMTCPTLGSLEFGTVVSSSNEYGGKASFSCDLGYTLVGSTEITCLSLGTWSENKPNCLIKTCPAILPSDITNGFFSATNFDFGSHVYFHCNEGYILQGSQTVECTHSASWNTSHPECFIVTCPQLEQLISGTTYLQSNEYGQVAEFSCDKGYNLIGPQSVKCLSSGLWNESLPSCDIVSCGQAPVIDHGLTDTQGQNLVYSAKVVYSCNFGYSMLGSGTLICTDRGTFDVRPPTCSRIPCPKLNDIDFGAITELNDTFVSITCVSGFYLEGEPVLECLLGGNWSSSTPTCLPIPCPTPPEIDNGKYSGNVFSYGNFVTYMCNKGYELSGYPIRVCENNGHWGGEDLECRPVSCGPPDDIENGYVTGGVLTYKQTVEYFCNDGFEMKGKSNRTCRKDGTWSRKVPRCIRLSCPVPTPIANCQIHGSDDLYESEITYECSIGYILKGNMTRRCESTLTWSGSDPVCERRPCPPPPAVANSIIIGDSFFFEDTINIVCKSGYRLEGVANRVCQSDGQWSESDPRCVEIFCMVPPKCDKCQIMFDQDINQFKVNSTVQYRCVSGYALSGTGERVCQSSGLWSDNFMKCDPISCKPIASVNNGLVKFADPFNQFQYQSIAFFACLEGFSLEGDMSIECLASREWSSEVSKCVIKICPPLPIENGITTWLSNSIDSHDTLESQRQPGLYVAGDIIKYACNNGYELNGPEETSCSVEATWATTDTLCIPVSCPLPDIANALFSHTQAVFGDIVTVSCQQGLNLIGEDELGCGSNGKWKEKLPRCELLTCGAPPFVDHSVLKGESFQLGDMAQYECKRGYELIGNSIITCGPGNQWLGSPPVCVEISCGNPNQIPNSITLYDTTSYQSSAEIICDIGFKLLGSMTAECGADRTWIFDPLSECVPKDCGSPPEIEHGTFDMDSTTFGAVVFYTCDFGHFFQGSSSMQCDEEGDWVFEVPICSPVKCSEPPVVEHGSVSSNATFFSGLASYTCDVGYVHANGRATSLVCDNMGRWTGETPVCNIVQCGTPPTIGNAKPFIVDNNTHYSSSVTYTCIRGFETRGKTKLTCAASGEWEGDRHDCMKKDCSDLPDLNNGEYTSYDDTLYGAQTGYICYKGYIKIGPDSIMCQENGDWSSLNHICTPVDCSYPPSIEHSTIAVENTTYQSLVQYTCDNGYIMEGTSSSECLHTGQWSQQGTCKPVDCANPPQIPNANVSFTSATFQSKALYSCLPGYTLSVSDSLSCNELGSWEGVTPVCNIVNCSEPETIQHGTMEYAGIMYLSTAFYACNPGYILKGKYLISCQENGTWSHAAPECFPLDCSHPPDIKDGEVITTGTTFGAKAQYTCHAGNIMQGSPVAHCTEEGSWNTSAPQCTPVDCFSPPEIEHSVMTLSATTFGSQATYVCDPGFVIKGSAVITCQVDGSWSGKDEFHYCDMIDCHEPPDIANAVVNHKDTFFGAIAVYNCLPGFTRTIESVLTCGISGTWEGRKITCSQQTCSRLPEVLNGDFTHNGVFSIGSQATYTCHIGFTLVGNKVVTCSSTGLWSEAPVCAPVRCPPLPSFGNANLVRYSGRSFKSTALYQCKSGFRMAQSDGTYAKQVTTECSATSEWVLEFSFYCELIECSVYPPAIENGNVIAAGNLYQNTALYSCETGYSLAGDSVAICNENGRWTSSKQPVCSKVSCGAPPEVLDGTFEGVEFIYGSTVTYHCNHGFRRHGSNTIQCGHDGSWSSTDIRCEVIECILVPDLLNGEITSESVTLYRMGSTIHFRCHDGYLLNGPPDLNCLETGQWDDYFPVCDKVIGVCLETIDLDHAKIQPGKFPGDRIDVQCQEGYVPSGAMASVCRNDGSWTTPAGTCTRVSCGRPEVSDMRNVKVIGRSFLYGDHVYYICRYGFTPAHLPPRLTCLASGQWNDKPSCSAQCKAACQNGGLCIGMNRCKCMPGWVGRRCQQPICILPCLNGGRCVSPYKCSCPFGYGGSRCHKAKCSLPCQNGGRCIRPNKCQCRGRFQGKQCELLRIGYRRSNR